MEITARRHNNGDADRCSRRKESVHHYEGGSKPLYRHAERDATAIGTHVLEEEVARLVADGEEIAKPTIGAIEGDTISSCTLRDAWIEVITSNEKLRFFLTIAFVRPYDDEQAYKAVKNITKLINKSIWGRNWYKHKEKSIRGFIIAEPHEISLDLRNRLHFHLLLEARDGLTLASLKKGLDYAIARTYGPRRGIMVEPDMVDVREIYDLTGLSDYVTKTFNRKDWRRGDGISLLHHGGISGQLTRPRMHSARNHLWVPAHVQSS